MKLTASQLQILRNRQQRTKLNLFIFNPRPVLKARLKSNINKGAMTIPYGDVFLGSYASIEKDSTLLVGSADGLQDFGRIRIRSGSPTYFNVAENDDIRWESGSYLTALRYWDVLPVFPRMIKNPNNATDVIFYKDYDIPHTSQNNVLGVFPHVGTHRGVLIGENGTGTAYYTSSGTWNVMGSEVQSYEWAFEGGTPTGSTQAVPGYVAYTTPGDYVTRVKITSANGAVDTTYRYISVKNKIGQGSVTPVARWNMSTLSGSRDEGGYSVQITVYDNIEVSEGSVIIITSEDWYNGTRISFGGNNQNANDIFFVGYIESGSLKYSWDRSFFEFTASSVTALMKKTNGFSISVESKQAAAVWHELQDMDVRRAVYHYLKWHTTVLNTTDTRFNAEDRKIQFFDADRTSLYEAVNNLMTDTLMGSVSADRQGSLFIEQQPMGYANPTGTFAPVMDISRQDWRGTPNIEDTPYSQASYIELGGIAYSGAHTGTFSAHLSGAPGDTPAEHGGVETDPGGLALTGQKQLNQLTGNVFYNKKFRYPSISMDNAIALRNLDIAPYEVVQVGVQPEDTILGVRISNLYIPNGMQFTYDSENELLLSSLDLKSVVTGIPGDTILIPETPDDFEDPVDYPFPPIDDVSVYVITDPTLLDNVLVWIYDIGFFYTTNFSDERPTWQMMMTNLSVASVGNPYNFEITASGKVFAHFGAYIYKADELGGDWQLVFDANLEVDNPEEYPFPRSQTVMALGVDRNADENVFLLGSLIVTIFSTCLVYGFAWDGSKFTRVNNTFILIPSSSARFGIIIRTGGKWLMSYYGEFSLLTANVDGETFAISNIQAHTESSGAGILTNSKKSENSAIIKLSVPRYTEDGGSTWVSLSGTVDAPAVEGGAGLWQSIIDDGKGNIVYGKSFFDGYRYSIDNGSTFSDSDVVFSGTATAVNHIGDMSYIFGDDGGHFWAGHGIGYGTTGTSIFNKDGNVNYMITGSFFPMIFRYFDNFEI